MIYLDNSATTRVHDEVIERMVRFMREDFYNPSALYAPSIAVENAMKEVRDRVLRAVHLPGGKVVFTSGGTESDNLAIQGSSRMNTGRILYSAGEHAAVREACIRCGNLKAEAIPYDPYGRVDLAAFEKMLADDVVFVAVMQVNNETGAVQPLREIGLLINRLSPEAVFHVDGVQGFLRCETDMQSWKAHTYSLSAHKIHGPKGIGALVVASGISLRPCVFGGGQERGLRSGTENTPGIVGLGAAIESYPDPEKMRALKCLLAQKILQAIPDARINGPDPESEESAPHILNLSVPPVRGETMLHALEADGILIGTGSACASRRQRISPVLSAMHIPGKTAESALRFSLCPDNTEEEITETAERLIHHYRILSCYQRK